MFWTARQGQIIPCILAFRNLFLSNEMALMNKQMSMPTLILQHRVVCVCVCLRKVS